MIDRKAVQAELNRVVTHESTFGPRSRLKPLLVYLVGEELEGRGDRIKAYTVGTDAFGRGTDFDPNTDSIVRVEMKRLRDALDGYYAGPGADDPVRISIPVGRYRPVFEQRSVEAAEPVTPTESVTTPDPEPAVIVPPGEAAAVSGVSAEGGRARHVRIVAAVCGVLAVVVLGYLLGPFGSPSRHQPRFDELVVQIIAEDEQSQAIADALLPVASRFNNVTLVKGDLDRPATQEDYRLALRTVGEDDAAEQLAITLEHSNDGEVVASFVVTVDERDLGGDGTAELTPLRQAIGRFLGRSGSAMDHYLQHGDQSPVLRCRALVASFRRERTEAAHLSARQCVEEGLEAGARHPSLYVVKSYLDRVEHDLGYNRQPGVALERALAAAQNAVQLDGEDAEAHYARMAALVHLGSAREAIEAGRTARRLNPFDGDIIGGIAVHLVTLGEFEQGMELLERAGEILPGAVRWRDYGYFLAHFALGEMDMAAGRALALAGSRNPLYLAAVAIGYEHLGNHERAQASLAALESAGVDIVALYDSRNYAPRLAEALVASIREIGGEP